MASSGDGDAVDDDGFTGFAAFVRSRQDALLRTAFLLTGDVHLAEDLVQGALTKLATHWRRVRTGSPEGFVRTVMYRDSVSWWRKRRERPQQELAEAVEPDAAEHVPHRLLMAQALARLPRRQRAVVVLRFYEDRSVAEAAEILNVSPGTVKSQTHAALQQLRRDMADLDEFITEGELQ